MKKFKLGFLASGGGSNMQAIVDACNSGYLQSKPALVISNNADSKALNRAVDANIDAVHISSKTNPDDEDDAILSALKEHDVDLVILSGYMKKIGPKTISAYKDRILNIHPALLPKHGGEGMYGPKVHETVLESGNKESGATIHIVDEIYDNGKIVNQVKVDVVDGETVESLRKKVLKAEHKLYPETIRQIETGEIDL